jgi:hypothetical protein
VDNGCQPSLLHLELESHSLFNYCAVTHRRVVRTCPALSPRSQVAPLTLVAACWGHAW